MSEHELLDLIRTAESDRLEFTTSRKDLDKLGQAVCAFANDLPGHNLPGYYIVGIDDSGEVAGMDIDDVLMKDLGSFRSNGLVLPIPSMTVERVETSKGAAAVVRVEPHQLPPVRYKGKAWVRSGPAKAAASEADERRLVERRVSHALSFDALPCLDAAMEDLTLSLFQSEYLPQAVDAEVLKENHRPVDRQLASLGFFHTKTASPTHAGLLLFGTDSRRFLPGAYVQFLRINGTSLADEPFANKEISGDLIAVTRQLAEHIRLHLAERREKESLFKETQVPDYPEAALREMLMNAIMHRDYASTAPIRFYWFDDRVEVQNPGGLYGETNAENFPNTNSYRNPVVASAMKVLGYVERFGAGVAKANAAMERNGNPPIEFTIRPDYFLAVLRKAP